MGEDLNQMTCEELIAEAKKLRQGVRQHRNSFMLICFWRKLTTPQNLMSCSVMTVVRRRNDTPCEISS